MVKVYRKHVTVAIIFTCVTVLMFALVSWGITQGPTTYSSGETNTLTPSSVSTGVLLYDEGAERVDITLEYFPEEEFDIWLVDDAHWDIRDSQGEPDPWLRHGIAGAGVIEWSVSASEFEGNLLLVEENEYYGQRGTFANSTTINYDWEITTRSIENPMESNATWGMFGFLVLAVVLLALQNYVPHETFQDFSELYPDFPESVDVAEVESEGT
jgi:hypothetical protein